MADLKTQKNDASAEAYLNAVPDEKKRQDSFATGKSCLYIKKLEDVDRATLEELVRQSVEHMIESHET